MKRMTLIIGTAVASLLAIPFVEASEKPEQIPVLIGKAKYACTTVTDEHGQPCLMCQIKIPINTKMVDLEPPPSRTTISQPSPSKSVTF